MKNTSSKCNHWTLGLGAMLGLFGCSSTANPGTMQNGMPSGVVAGSSGTGASVNNTGTAGKAAGALGATGSSGTPAIGGKAGTTGGAAGMPAGTAGTIAAGTGGTQATAGTGGGAGSGAAGGPATGDKIHCMSGTFDSNKLCDVFTKANGGDIELGPYGAVVDINQGSGGGGTDDSALCTVFVASFMEDQKLSDQLQDITTSMLDFDKYTVFRPGRWAEGEKYPLITWGNGTCAQPEGYGALLRYIASYGFIIVAANNREVGGGQPLLHGLDIMTAANTDMSSPYYNRIDTDHIGIMGHSQGAGAALTASSDPRTTATILFNGGANSLSTPIALVSAEMDIGDSGPGPFQTSVQGATGKAMYIYYHHPAGMGPLKGHLTLMLEPERVMGWATAWWQMFLKGDASAKAWFAPAASCMLCNQTADYEYGEKGLD